MDWLSWLVPVVLVFWLWKKLSKFKPKKISKRAPVVSEGKSERDEAEEAENIAAKITTAAQYRALEQKLEKHESTLGDQKTEKAYDNACSKANILQAAIDIAESKIFNWQLIPVIDLQTPQSVLEHAYKLYSNEEYEQLRTTISNKYCDWLGLTVWDEEEEVDEDLPFLKKFRAVIESDKPQQEKVENINKLVAADKRNAKDFFDLDGHLKPGEQWFAGKLHNYGLPQAYELYAEGYTTPVKCLKIDPNEFIKRKGIGPKKKQQLEAFQEKVKKAIAKKKVATT